MFDSRGKDRKSSDGPAAPKPSQANSIAVHADFPLGMGHWQWNLLAKSPTAHPYPHKVRFHFSEAEKDLLSGCPVRAKIGRSRGGPMPFVGYIYPDSEKDEKIAIEWAMRFSCAELCTRGQFSRGSWLPGTVIRPLK